MSLDDKIRSHESELTRLRRVKTWVAEMEKHLLAIPDEHRKEVLIALRERFCSNCGRPGDSGPCEYCYPQKR